MRRSRHQGDPVSGVNVLRVVTLRSARGSYGGPADTATNQARIAADGGASVTLLSGVLPRDEPPPLAWPGVATVQVGVRHIAKRFGFASLFSLRLVPILWRSVRRADVVHVSYAREIIPVLAAGIALMQRVPLVIQPHGMLTARVGVLQKCVDLLVKPIYRRSVGVIALTSREHQQLEQWCPSRCPVFEIGNPALQGSSRSLASTSHAMEAVFVARLEKRKRVIDFVDAALISEHRWPQIRYRIIGPDQGELRAIRGLVEQSQVLDYEGALPPEAVPERLGRAGVFVLTSENEPWGNVLATAICMGIPVVVTRSAALSGLIESYGAGRVVNDRHAQEVAEAVADLLTDGAKRARAVEGGLNMSRDVLGTEAVSSKIAQTYAYAVQAKPGRMGTP